MTCFVVFTMKVTQELVPVFTLNKSKSGDKLFIFLHKILHLNKILILKYIDCSLNP